MNKREMREIVKRLNEIKNNINIIKNEGVCYNLYHRTNNRGKIKSTYTQNDGWLEDQFRMWPDCRIDQSGEKDVRYPIDAWHKYRNEYELGTIWENPKRLKLVDFLIERATAQLKQMN